MDTKHDLSSSIRREARVVGLRGFNTPSLESVERRRLQLWVLSAILLVSVSLGVVVLSIWPVTQQWSPVSPGVLRLSVVLLSIAFSIYAVEQELHLHRLARMLIDERVLSTALTNRLHEVSLLLDAGKAINSVLDLSAVLETILRSAIDLLGGTSGSIMLAEGDTLVSSSVQGNDLARGRRVPIGEGIAGHVARTREPLLIDGDATPEDFPGLTPRDTPIESAISVPLVNRGDLLGVLNVNAAVGRTFTEYDLRAMSVFAEQAAAAIANARLYEAEREHVAELIELDQMKRDFLDLMTHELRTPITSVLAAVEIAGRPGMEAERDEMHEIIARQGRRLDDMVGSLLMAARLERTETPQSIVVVDVGELARKAAAESGVLQHPVEVTGVDVAWVLGDGEALRHVLENLIDNAWKYGVPPVRVDVTAEADRVVLSVLDAGAGIPPEDRERIFERFQRLDKTRAQPGLGLGLPIVRGFARSLGGDVWIDDAPGGGAAFHVSLRRAVEEDREAG
jgi:two-component system, OmpR family, sensor histidine kinase KdpD